MIGLVLVIVTACDVPDGPPIASESATGVVISADGPSAADVDRLTLRTEDGRVLELTVGPLDLSNGGLPAPHLREHLVSGEPITVSYTVQDATNVLSRYVDAPP